VLVSGLVVALSDALFFPGLDSERNNAVLPFLRDRFPLLISWELYWERFPSIIPVVLAISLLAEVLMK
jgi:hypothetical protein